ncbi:hypothetical protein [Rhizobium sp. LjRoot254]|uniref:hypothetical protein n=1 Tax=Rhizobium sp. LjRoot254 TaxID=3342297 RepID=UPI003ED13856
MPTITTPIILTGNDNITLAAGDILDVSTGPAVTWTGTGTAVTFTNNGFITDGDDQAFELGNTLPTGTLIFNNSLGATVDAEVKFEDLAAGSTVTINNDGLMTGRDKNALELSTAGATFIVNNHATGVMTQDDPGSDIIKDASNLTLNNAGKIISAGDIVGPDGEPVETGGDAIDLGEGTNNVINNLAGGIIEGSRHGITGDIGATVNNAVGGVISARNGAGLNFDNNPDDPADLEDAILTVVNRGVILGNSRTYEDSDGDAIDADGLLMLDNYGFVGGMGAAGEHDGGTNHAEGIAAGGGTINNHLGGVIFSVQRAIQIDDSSEGAAPGAVTINNQGIIQGLDGGAIVIVGEQNDTLTNSGTILGDITMGGGDDTVTFSKGSNVVGDIMLGAGDDTFTGWSGDDMIFGGAGVDEMTGGRGADTFLFATGDTGGTKATADTIFDFKAREGDLLDLTDVDANSVLVDDQAFKFIGTKDFHDKAGELRYVTDKNGTWIQGDTDGNGKADFLIHLDDKMAMKADYFDL